MYNRKYVLNDKVKNMYEDEDFPDVPQDVMDIVDMLEDVLDGTYNDNDDYAPLDFNED